MSLLEKLIFYSTITLNISALRHCFSTFSVFYHSLHLLLLLETCGSLRASVYQHLQSGISPDTLLWRLISVGGDK